MLSEAGVGLDLDAVHADRCDDPDDDEGCTLIEDPAIAALLADPDDDPRVRAIVSQAPAVADAFVVGSALVERIARKGAGPEALEELRTLARELIRAGERPDDPADRRPAD